MIDVDTLTYEQAFAELEALIDTLENRPPTLEESLSLYERGRALAQRCTALLDQAELRIQKLSGAAGEPSAEESA